MAKLPVVFVEEKSLEVEPGTTLLEISKMIPKKVLLQ